MYMFNAKRWAKLVIVILWCLILLFTITAFRQTRIVCIKLWYIASRWWGWRSRHKRKVFTSRKHSPGFMTAERELPSIRFLSIRVLYFTVKCHYLCSPYRRLGRIGNVRAITFPVRKKPWGTPPSLSSLFLEFVSRKNHTSSLYELGAVSHYYISPDYTFKLNYFKVTVTFIKLHSIHKKKLSNLKLWNSLWQFK